MTSYRSCPYKKSSIDDTDPRQRHARRHSLPGTARVLLPSGFAASSSPTTSSSSAHTIETEGIDRTPSAIIHTVPAASIAGDGQVVNIGVVLTSSKLSPSRSVNIQNWRYDPESRFATGAAPQTSQLLVVEHTGHSFAGTADLRPIVDHGVIFLQNTLLTSAEHPPTPNITVCRCITQTTT